MVGCRAFAKNPGLCFRKSPPPETSSTCCILLLINIMTWRSCGGVDFLKLIDKYIVSDKIRAAWVWGSRIFYREGGTCHRCRVNVAHIRQSRPNSSLGVLVKVFSKLQVFASALASRHWPPHGGRAFGSPHTVWNPPNVGKADAQPQSLFAATHERSIRTSSWSSGGRRAPSGNSATGSCAPPSRSDM